MSSGDCSLVHAQLSQHTQAAHARWNGAAELVVVEPAESTSNALQCCAVSTFSAAHAQVCQRSQAAKA